jgi:hypothetical protein
MSEQNAEFVRPVPPTAPPGMHFEVVPDPNWQIGGTGRCRQPKCEKWGVARLNRRARSAAGVVDRWWNYCEDDLYGRWIEDGRVMYWRLVDDGAQEGSDA